MKSQILASNSRLCAGRVRLSIKKVLLLGRGGRQGRVGVGACGPIRTVLSEVQNGRYNDKMAARMSRAELSRRTGLWTRPPALTSPRDGSADS